MSVDWYRRKLGGDAPPPPAQVAPYPTATPPVGPTRPYTPPPPTTPIDSVSTALATGAWRGGEGTASRDRCPACGSGHYFTREKQAVQGKAPAPLCYTCGYNGMFDQFGNQDQ